MPTIDGQRVVADLKRLAEFGQYKTGVHRPTYSPVDVESRHWLAGKLREAGLDHKRPNLAVSRDFNFSLCAD